MPRSSSQPIARARTGQAGSGIPALLLGLLLAALTGIPDLRGQPDPTGGGIVREPLFDGPVLHWDVQVRRTGLEKLRKSGGPWNREQDEDALATVRAGGQVWTNVAVHLKGAAGSFRPVDDLPALTLNFGKFQDGQTCQGHRKLHLNNSVQDAARMDEVLASEMFLRSGVPTPRATRALVSLNGRYLGIYVLKGGWDKPFLKQHFGSSKGNFYDPGFLKDLDTDLERDSGEGIADWADLVALRQALRVEDPAQRLEQVGRRLDLDRITTLAALQILLDDWDGYLRNRNNYRVYHAPDSDRLVLMPHGMDQLWRNPRGSFTPPLTSLLGRRLFTLPTMADRLSHRMRDLTNTVFQPGFVDGVFTQAQARLRERLEQEGRASEFDSVQRAADETLRRTRQRMAAFAGQPYQPPQAAQFDNDGRMRLTGWQTMAPGKADPQSTSPVTADDDARVLRLTATPGENRTSLQKRLLLPPGLYRFEARVRTRSVSGPGASLGVEAGRRGQRIEEGQATIQRVTGTREWTALSREISLQSWGGRRRPGGGPEGGGDSPREVVLHAELIGPAGIAEFDPEAFVIHKR
ncbi:MAG: Inner spore coat protein [Verrucomicrobiota bacterium]